jgi:hypothetical protein
VTDARVEQLLKETDVIQMAVVIEREIGDVAQNIGPSILSIEDRARDTDT